MTEHTLVNTPSESSNNGKHSWFKSPDAETNCWSGIQWRPATGGCQHRTPATLHKPFHEEPGRMLSRGRQSMCRPLWHTSKISQKFAGELNLVCSTTARTKTALGIIQVWFNYFTAPFFKAHDNVNVNYLKIPKKHRGPHKRPSRATCGRRAACLRHLLYRILYLEVVCALAISGKPISNSLIHFFVFRLSFFLLSDFQKAFTEKKKQFVFCKHLHW